VTPSLYRGPVNKGHSFSEAFPAIQDEGREGPFMGLRWTVSCAPTSLSCADMPIPVSVLLVGLQAACTGGCASYKCSFRSAQPASAGDGVRPRTHKACGLVIGGRHTLSHNPMPSIYLWTTHPTPRGGLRSIALNHPLRRTLVKEARYPAIALISEGWWQVA
jgi:hypothetical protein